MNTKSYASSSASTDLVKSSKWSLRQDSMNDVFAECNTKLTITSSFIKIFENAYEGATWCWTTVANCPFKIEKPNSSEGALILTRRHLASGGLWRRMINLDKKFQYVRPQRLSTGEIIQVINTLKLTIMAFASQWGLKRNDSHQNPSSFAHLMHRSLYNEGSRALDRCSHLNSFCIILSALLFALIDNPNYDETKTDTRDIGEDQDFDYPKASAEDFDTISDLHETNSPPPGSEVPNDQSWTSTPKVADVSKDWRPIAFRHLLFWKQHLLNTIVIRKDAVNFTLNPEYKDYHNLSEGDIEDFFLLYWHALAYDSILSLTIDTPFSLGEEVALAEGSSNLISKPHSPLAQFLGVKTPVEDRSFLAPAHLSKLQFSPPGRFFLSSNTMEVVELALQDVIPTIMLHWKRVGKLRGCLTAETVPSNLEDIFHGALQVYDQWRQSHEHTMNFCLENYSNLSFKVQTWYIYLYSSWTLGCFFFAEFIEDIDKKFDTGHPQRFWRISTSYAYNMSKYSAFTFARLAEVIVSDIPKTSEYHEFIGESGAHEGQPWPLLFNTCLMKACDAFLDWIVQSSNSSQDTEHLWLLRDINIPDLILLSARCIKGLKEFGWKSRTIPQEGVLLQARLEEIRKRYYLV